MKGVRFDSNAENTKINQNNCKPQKGKPQKEKVIRSFHMFRGAFSVKLPENCPRISKQSSVIITHKPAYTRPPHHSENFVPERPPQIISKPAYPTTLSPRPIVVKARPIVKTKRTPIVKLDELENWGSIDSLTM